MSSKKCSKCGVVKDISEYYLTGRYTLAGKNIPRAKCKSCVGDVKNERRANIRAWLNSLKETLLVLNVDTQRRTHPDFTAKALEFHHPQDNKEFAIGEAPGKGMAIEKIKKEIDKCVILCARCHMEIHNK